MNRPSLIDDSHRQQLSAASTACVAHRAKSESPPGAGVISTTTTGTRAAAKVHRIATTPALSNSETMTPPSECQPNQRLAAALSSREKDDAALVSTLLNALSNYSTSGTSATGHGSPVMILKDLIDKHFSEPPVASPGPADLMTIFNTNHVCISLLVLMLIVVKLLKSRWWNSTVSFFPPHLFPSLPSLPLEVGTLKSS